MTLSGVTIGSSSDGMKGGKEDKPRQNPDRRPELENLTSATRKPVNVGSVGGALDLFV
jgi:hypothetical protein